MLNEQDQGLNGAFFLAFSGPPVRESLPQRKGRERERKRESRVRGGSGQEVADYEECLRLNGSARFKISRKKRISVKHLYVVVLSLPQGLLSKEEKSGANPRERKDSEEEKILTVKESRPIFSEFLSSTFFFQTANERKRTKCLAFQHGFLVG